MGKLVDSCFILCIEVMNIVHIGKYDIIMSREKCDLTVYITHTKKRNIRTVFPFSCKVSNTHWVSKCEMVLDEVKSGCSQS